jgi:hypothetical protein
MGALLRAGQLVLGIAVAAAAISSCYSAGEGTDPPPNTFYFPVGLAVSDDGNVLYVANSDFDLQWNGGTLQTYDLVDESQVDAGGVSVRADAKNQITNNLAGNGCAVGLPPDGGAPLGQECSPPRDSTSYRHHSVVIGALATDAQLSVHPDATGVRRLFVPVRGEAAVTWASVGPNADSLNPTDEFAIECGQGVGDNPSARCDASHSVGSNPDQFGNTRNVTMPGEPFGMAQSQDGSVIAITSQTDTKTSLLTTGLVTKGASPILQFVLDGLPAGGVGIAAVPHDPDAPQPPCELVGDQAPCVRPAFLQTNRNVAELDLLRYYDDDGTVPLPPPPSAPQPLAPSPSNPYRPFLVREAVYPITSNAVGTDSRGIAIDSTPRIACKAQGNPAATCAQLPARVFFASRTPAALGIGQIGGFPPSGVGPYNPDLLVLLPPVSLPPGPSNVYLAPIVDQTGALALRVFVVLFDSNQIVVYDPDAQAIDKIITVGVGPFAMAFDPFTFEDVGGHQSIKAPRADGTMPFAYRFAYVASFTQSYVQLIDLDDSQPTAETFENVVFTLGKPTLPKGQ